MFELDMLPAVTVARHEIRTQLPVVVRLRALACEFDEVAEFHANHGRDIEVIGDRCANTEAQARQAAAQLRCVATFVVVETYSQAQGNDWLRAAWRIINAIGRGHIG